MPTYSYVNKDTGEKFDKTMSISEMTEYEDNNPNIQRVYNKIAIVDPVGIGVTKPPSDFSKYVLGKVKAGAPGSNSATMEKRWQIPKEV